MRVLWPRVFFSHAPAAVLIFPVSLFAQWIAPSGGDPVSVACPSGPTSGLGIDAQQAWEKGRQFAQIEGDGVFGIGNWGHVPESLVWYCKASAAGNAVAAYDIAEIFREGYVVNSRGPGGQIITKHYLADLPTAFYWYRLAADRGFTKGMLAVAQYYALGDQTLKGSHVPRDWDKAWDWLSKAADKEDTIALQMLAFFYAGLKPAPWGMALLPPKDAKAKAAALAISAGVVIKKVNSYCTNLVTIQAMIDDLPDASYGRKPKWASVAQVHGWTKTAPMQWECILSLGTPPPSQQNEPLLDQFYRLIHGGAVNVWAYSFTQVPGNDVPAMFRETATQAMVEGIEEMAVILETISPLSSSGSSTTPTRQQKPSQSRNSPIGPNGWRRFDMNGVWEATYGVRGAAGYHVIDIKIEDDGDYITAELLSAPANAFADDIVLFAAIYDSDDIAATMSPTTMSATGHTDRKPNYRHAMIHIDDADHFRLEGYPPFRRIKR